MLSTHLWITLFLVLWFYVLWSRRRLYKLMLQVPGPIGYPIIGSMLEFWLNNGFLAAMQNTINKYGSTWMGWFGPMPVYFVSDPVLNQELLNSPQALSKGSVANSVMEELLGKGLIVLEDPVWSKHRKALNSAFSHNGLLSFIPIFNNEGSSFIEELDTQCDKGEIEIFTRLKNFTLRIATQTTMGTDAKKEAVYQDDTLINKYQSALDAGIVLILKPWYVIKWFRRWTEIGKLLDNSNFTIRTFIKKMIESKLLDASNNNPEGNKNNTFINLAIDQLRSQVFNYQNVEDEANTIVFAAFETTALTITYTLMHLAMFPEYQDKLYEKIKSVFPHTGDFEVSFEDIQKLEYLEMVIYETMRLMPPIPLAVRRCTTDVKLSNGVVLPKDMQFCISIFHTHRSKEIWGPKAEIFNPENCSPSSLKEKHPYSLIPFLKGKRNCIGWKYGLILLKITLVKILRNYKVSTSFRFEDLVIVNNITLTLKDLPGLEFKHRAEINNN